MSFHIERGLFLFDFIDHHAILGMSITADAKEIRKSYLRIARRLHPDSGAAESDADRYLAGQLLSKLVNPAWEKLSQDKSRTEHLVLLKLKGQAAAHKQNQLEIMGALAKHLSTANNPEHYYQTALQELADRQYEKLDQVVEVTAQISELNMVYLIRKEGTGQIGSIGSKNQSHSSENGPPTGASTPNSQAATTRPGTKSSRETIIEQYCRRAEGFVAKGNYAQATLELRDALKVEPNHSRCHSLMGMVYLRQNQVTMAKIHFNKALSIDPQDAIALEGKQKLDQLAGKSAPPDAAAKSASKLDPSKSGSGLFGGLFGGKKK